MHFVWLLTPKDLLLLSFLPSLLKLFFYPISNQNIKNTGSEGHLFILGVKSLVIQHQYNYQKKGGGELGATSPTSLFHWHLCLSKVNLEK